MKLKKRFKYNKSKMFVYLFIALAFSGVSLGYAFLSTDLDINGALKVAKSSWDIHFENVQVNENSSNSVTGSSGVPTISNDTTVNFSVGLDNPGEFYEFTVDVVNDGTINAKIGGIEILPQLTNEQKKYFEYKVIYSDGIEIKLNDALNAGDTETLLIRFKYLENDDDSVYPEEDVDFDFSVSIDYVQGEGTEREHTLNGTVYAVNYWDYTAPGYNAVWLDEEFPENITYYRTPEEAMAAIAEASGYDLPFYTKHKVVNGIVTESYLDFIITEELAQEYPGMVPGTYSLRGDKTYIREPYTVLFGNDYISPYYEVNKEVLKAAVGYATDSSRCYESGTGIHSNFNCTIQNYDVIGDYINIYTRADGNQHVFFKYLNTEPLNCGISEDGTSGCGW